MHNPCKSVSTHKAQITINKNSIADLAALEIALKAELAKNPEIGVHLYADQTVVYAKNRRSNGNSTTCGL